MEPTRKCIYFQFLSRKQVDVETHERFCFKNVLLHFLTEINTFNSYFIQFLRYSGLYSFLIFFKVFTQSLDLVSVLSKLRNVKFFL